METCLKVSEVRNLEIALSYERIVENREEKKLITK